MNKKRVGFYQKIKKSIKKIDNIAPKIIGEIQDCRSLGWS